jgi:cytochrome c-type biogenesis protein CcmF
VISEFVRGGRVIAGKSGQNLFASMVQLAHRNTRRYGGYIVHFGVIVIMIGFAGAAFNQDKEQEMGYGDKMNIGAYTLLCKSYTQDDKPNYGSEWAVMEVYKDGKLIDTLYPERRFYKASQQTATMVANRSTPKEDLYVVYEGLNQDTGRPIIKVHLNPLVMWIWVGVWTMIAGTIIALIPNAVPARVTAPARVQAAPVGAD